MIKFEDDIENCFINSGAYGIVLKCLSGNTPPHKINQVTFSEAALKVNLKYTSEKVIGISSCKELSSLVTLKSSNNNNVIDIIDYVEEDVVEKYKNEFIKVSKRDKDVHEKEIDKIHFLFERMDMDLTNFISNYHVTKENIIKVVEDVYLGLYWCYLNNVLHRDLKLCNILVKMDPNGSLKTIKICDFGLSCYVKKVFDYKSKTPKVTTSTYRSPEVIYENEYSFKMDYWAFGLIMLQLICGNYRIDLKMTKRTIDKHQAMVNKIISDNRKKVDDKFDKKFLDNYFDLIQKLLIVDPDKRIGLKDFYESNTFFNKKTLNVRRKKMKKEYDQKQESNRKRLIDFKRYKEELYRHDENSILEYKRQFLLLCLKISVGRFDWFKEQIIFHSLYTFDKFLISPKNTMKDKFKENMELLSYSILYIYHKFFSTLITLEWSSFIEEFKGNRFKSLKDKEIQYIADLELFLVREIYNHQLYELTEYEVEERPVRLSSDVKLSEIKEKLNINHLSNLEKYILNEYFREF